MLYCLRARQALNTICIDDNVCYSWIRLDFRQWWTLGRLYRTRYSEINSLRVELHLFSSLLIYTAQPWLFSTNLPEAVIFSVSKVTQLRSVKILVRCQSAVTRSKQLPTRKSAWKWKDSFPIRSTSCCRKFCHISNTWENKIVVRNIFS